MERYGRAGGAFSTTHERFVHGEHGLDWEALRRAEYAPGVREQGRRSFVLRALDEQRSLLAFSELLSELCEAGAPIDVIGSLTRVVRDEARHVDQCQRVVQALGGWPDDAPEPGWVRSDARLPLRRRILRTIVGSLCLGETVSVAMIAGVRGHASDPVVHELLTRLLADESYHSRFGWWWLERFVGDLRDDDHAFLEAWLPRAFGAIERAARPSQQALARPRAHRHSPFGSMSPAEREAAFRRALERTIFPGFRGVGIDGEAAWKRRPHATRAAAA